MLSLQYNLNIDTSRKETLVCMRIEVSKTVQFERLQCWCYEWEGFMNYAIEMVSSDLKLQAFKQYKVLPE
jgi:hypothetical protein